MLGNNEERAWPFSWRPFGRSHTHCVVRLLGYYLFNCRRLALVCLHTCSARRNKRRHTSFCRLVPGVQCHCSRTSWIELNMPTCELPSRKRERKKKKAKTASTACPVFSSCDANFSRFSIIYYLVLSPLGTTWIPHIPNEACSIFAYPGYMCDDETCMNITTCNR